VRTTRIRGYLFPCLSVKHKIDREEHVRLNSVYGTMNGSLCNTWPPRFPAQPPLLPLGSSRPQAIKAQLFPGFVTLLQNIPGIVRINQLSLWVESLNGWNMDPLRNTSIHQWARFQWSRRRTHRHLFFCISYWSRFLTCLFHSSSMVDVMSRPPSPSTG